MKITQISINGFGKFHDVTFELSGPLTCFYGYNEAGKSTLMGFIRSILFGFPTRSNPRERYEPLRGGLHGGSITIVNERGEHFRIERMVRTQRGSSSSEVTLYFPDGTIGGPNELQQFLGGLTGDVFRNLFAFSLSELQEMSALQSDEISGYLFNAGVGAGASRIIEAEKQIKQEMDQLYRPKGRKQDIPLLLKTMDDTQVQLQSMKESVAQFNSHMKELEENMALIDELENKRKEAQDQLKWLENCIQFREQWIQLQQLRAELAEIPEFDGFPEDALSRYQELASEQDRLTLSLQQKTKKIDELTNFMDQIEIDEDLLNKEKTVQYFMEQLSSYQSAIHDIADLKHELQSVTEELERSIRKINHQWTEAELRAFPVSIREQENINTFRERFALCQKQIEHWQQEADRVKSQQELEAETIRQLQEKIKLLQQKRQEQYPWLKSEDSGQLRSFLTKIRREAEHIQHHLHQIQQHKQRIEDLRETGETFAEWNDKQSKSSKTRRVLYGISLGMNVAVPIFFMIDGQWLLSAVSFLLLAVFNTILYISSRSSAVNPDLQNLVRQHEQRMGELQHQIDALSEQLKQKQHALMQEWSNMFSLEAAATWDHTDDSFARVFREPSADIPDFLAQVDAGLNALERIIDDIQKNELLKSQLESRYTEHEQSIRSMEEYRRKIEQKLQQYEEQYEHWQQEWKAWLNDCQLKEDLSVESVTEIFRIAEHGVQLLARKEKIAAKLHSRLNWMEQFENRSREALQLSEDAPIESTIRQVHRTLDEHRKRQMEKRNLEQQISALQEECDGIRSTLQQITDRIHKLWQDACAEDEEQFRLHSKWYMKRLDIEDEIRKSEITFANWFGFEQREKLDTTLREYNLDQLQEMYNGYATQLKKWEQHINELRERNGKLQSELERLKSGEDLALLLQEQQEQLSTFYDLTGQWAARALCLRLFQKAKEVYERDKQPRVLKKASEYFALITNQQFTRVTAPIGEERIMVERTTGEWLDSAFLSRGTAEQLYLAMRFALAEEYAAKIPLPIIMDDIFVNFDFSRMLNSFKLLKEVCSRHQIIIFTCHDHVHEALKKTIPELQSIRLHHV